MKRGFLALGLALLLVAVLSSVAAAGTIPCLLGRPWC